MRTLEERLAQYRADFLEKVKRWNWDADEDRPCRKGRKSTKLTKQNKSRCRTEGEKRAWEQQQQQLLNQQSKKYNWF